MTAYNADDVITKCPVNNAVNTDIWSLLCIHLWAYEYM